MMLGAVEVALRRREVADVLQQILGISHNPEGQGA